MKIRFITVRPLRKDLDYIVHVNTLFQRDIKYFLEILDEGYRAVPIVTIDEVELLYRRLCFLRELVKRGVKELFIYSTKSSCIKDCLDYLSFLKRFFDVCIVSYHVDVFIQDYPLYVYYFDYVDSILNNINVRGVVVSSRYFVRVGKCVRPVEYRYVNSLLIRAGCAARRLGLELVIDISDIELRKVLQ